MALIKCSNCGMEVNDNEKVCPSCGNKLMEEIVAEETTVICKDCGNEIPHDAKFVLSVVVLFQIKMKVQKKAYNKQLKMLL